MRLLRKWHNNEIKKINLKMAEDVINTRVPLGLFYVLGVGLYTGIDNSYGDAWTETFPDLRRCKRWLSNKNIDINEL